MPYLPNSTRKLITREKLWSFSMKSSFKVSDQAPHILLKMPYQAKSYLSDGLECGGAYLKLLQDNKKLHAEEFSNASPYVIMFGPDKCGATNKVGKAMLEAICLVR